MTEFSRSTIVMVCGSHKSQLGYSDNLQPSYTIPTAIAVSYNAQENGNLPSCASGLSNVIGDEAVSRQSDHVLQWPIRQGLVHDWDLMECFWHECLVSYLRMDPESHTVMVPQAGHASARDRAIAMEVLFETLGASALALPPAPVLVLSALAASRSTGSSSSSSSERTLPSLSALTGLVVHCGHDVTHAVPVLHGVVLDNGRRSTPLAGEHINHRMADVLRSRAVPLPGCAADMYTGLARDIKEAASYVCFDASKEALKYEDNPHKYGIHHRYQGAQGQVLSLNLDRERFLGPEVLFNPAAAEHPSWCGSVPLSLSHLVLDCVMACPVDVRRQLYSNLVLCGGTSRLRHLDRRLQYEVSRQANTRLHPDAQRIEVNVTAVPCHASFTGASLMAQSADFRPYTQEQYQELGAAYC